MAATGADSSYCFVKQPSAALEIQLGAELVPACVRDNAPRRTVIHIFRVASVVASEIVMIQCVEQVQRYSDRRHVPEPGKSLRSLMSTFWYGNVPGTVNPPD